VFELAALHIKAERCNLGAPVNLLKIAALSFDVQSRELKHGDEKISLTPRESALMELLMSAQGKAVSKSRIVATMSSWESDFSSNAVEIYIMKLRRKLAGRGVGIETIRGVGYALQAEA